MPSSEDNIDLKRSSRKELGKKLFKLYGTKKKSDGIIEDSSSIENDLVSKNSVPEYDLPEDMQERRDCAKRTLSQIQAQMINDGRQELTDSETLLASTDIDIYDYVEYPDIKEALTRSLIKKVDEAAEKDPYGDEEEYNELFQIARIFEENQVASDLLKEAIDNGIELNKVGIAQIGDAIARDDSKSDSAVAVGLVRVEKIGYRLFDWNGADHILLRGPAFQEALNLEREINPEETDILYYHLKYYLQHANHYDDNISDLLTPSEDNIFAKIWQEDGDTIRNIFHRTPLGGDRFNMIDKDGNLTDIFSQNLIDNFSIDNANENEFMSRHLELFSSEELKDNLFRRIFNPSEEFKPDDMNGVRDQGLRKFFKLAGSESYDDNVAAKWFASFISNHTVVDEDHNNFFTISEPEDISTIAKIAPIISNRGFDGMSSYRSNNEQDRSWAKTDLGLVENCMVLWQLNHPEEQGLLLRFLDAGDSEGIDYAKEFPNFAETMRMFVFNRDNETETDSTKDEIINLLTNAIRNRDPYTNEYYNFLRPTDDGHYHYWNNFTNDSYDYYRRFTPEAIKQIPVVLTTLLTTSVEELSRNNDIVADRLLTYSPENADQIVKTLEGIYLRKDIPKFAKLYYSADMLYRDSLDNEEYGVPPFLKWAKSEESERNDSAREVLMTDLLKNSMRSNNSSLRAYLKSCIALKNDDSLSEQYEFTDATEGDYVEEFTDNKKFRRRFFGYANRLGYNNPEEMLEAMDVFRDRMNSLHKGNVAYDENGKARYTKELKGGDLIKGINSNHLHLAIRDGFNCPEMAGIGIYQDLTHWDTDFGSVRPEDETSTIDGKIKGSIANPYGDGLYAIVHRDELDAYDSSDGNVGTYDYALYEIYHRDDANDNFRGIRTGIGSEDIDAYVVNSNNSSRRKALRLGYEMAKNGIYAPIIDRNTEEVIFTPDDFEELRRKMGGLNSRYETLPNNYYAADDLSLPDSLTNKNELKYSELESGYIDRIMEGAAYEGGVRGTICSRLQFDERFPEEIRDIFIGILLSKAHDDHSKDAIEMIVTGSSARGTGIPNDIDVDIVMRLDRSIFNNYKDEILEALTTRYKRYYNGEKLAIDGGILTSRGIRKGHTEIFARNGQPTQVEVNISPVMTTNQRTFFSDEAAKERLNSSNRFGDTARIAANIITAKALLKEAHAYKTNQSPERDGGLGGLGVENWILQSGGSLRQACEEFLTAADDGNGGYVPFDDFSSRYAIFDMGENHFGNNHKSPYDNFIERNMNESGYRKMCNVCRDILRQINGN